VLSLSLSEMRVIAVKTIKHYWEKFPEAKQALLAWYAEEKAGIASLMEARGKSGKNYLIRVSAAGYQNVTASTYIPAPVQITKVEQLTFVPDNSSDLTFRIHFDDPGHEENFYRLLYNYIGKDDEDQVYPPSEYLNQGLHSEDPTLEPDHVVYSNTGMLFNDKRFNGSTAPSM
jgi:hypothetical protein